jgi:hypothetical protein
VDPVGTRIWRLLERGPDLRSMVAPRQDYQVEEDEMEESVDALLQPLARADLIAIGEAG